jgi:hypothetical protein
MKEENIVRFKYWMAWVGNHMGEIVGMITIIGGVVGLLGLFGYSIGEAFGHPAVGATLFPIFIIGGVTGLIVWHNWAEENSIQLKNRLIELEEARSKDIEESIGAMLRRQRGEMLVENHGDIVTSASFTPSIDVFADEDVKDVKEIADNARKVKVLSNSVEYFSSLARNEEKEKNAALEEAEKYKDLYERLLESHKILGRENEDLKVRLEKSSINAISDLE